MKYFNLAGEEVNLKYLDLIGTEVSFKIHYGEKRTKDNGEMISGIVLEVGKFIDNKDSVKVDCSGLIYNVLIENLGKIIDD